MVPGKVACVALLSLLPPIQAQRSVLRASSRNEASPKTIAVTLAGSVLDRDGHPASGAVVVTSAGGQALVDAGGSYWLEVELPFDAERVEVTAVGGPGGGFRSSRTVGLASSWATIPVEVLRLEEESPCEPEWIPTFGGETGVNLSVEAMVAYDDGNGTALYAAGTFTSVLEVSANRIAKWDGSSWTPLGGGLNSVVHALAVFDDGNGPALYAGGHFSTAGGVAANGIARWDGSTWAALGTGAYPVLSLAVYDDGGGEALYAGGSFETAGGVAAPRIAKWDGSTWASLGGGMDVTALSAVNALTVYDDGGGAALYAGGSFEIAGGLPARNIAKWDGSSWAPLGSGVNHFVYALTTHDDGGGKVLFAGGVFSNAGGVSASHIAKWDGSGWARLGGGTNNDVRALAEYDDGGGAALYAAGAFTTAGGAAASRIAKWDGSGWSPLGTGLDSLGFALAVHDAGDGAALYVGGRFRNAGGEPAKRIAQWDGSSWRAVNHTTPGGDVLALAVHDDGGGEALYAGGRFQNLGGLSASRIAKWDGSWSTLGSGMDNSVFAMTTWDDGGGVALYAGGRFQTAGGVPANRIARWNGASWAPLGGGLADAVQALVVYDDGTGEALYAGGLFTSAGGVSARGVARWDGSSWTPLGGGVNGTVFALAVYDDGGGAALYAGGSFGTAGGMPASRVAKWDGSSWTSLDGGVNGNVFALTVDDDGGGAALYAGGNFTTAGGLSASRIAKWDGSGWSPLGSGMNDSVRALTVHDDGGGRVLCAGGDFTTAGGFAANSTAKWNGTSWAPLGHGFGVGVRTLATYDAGRGPNLFVGGSFTSVAFSEDSYLARWGGCLRLGFDLEDDFKTPLANGQDVSSPAEFGRFVSISSSGPNAGAAIFDSTPGGPNDPSQDLDLLVGRDRLLILQTNQNTTQTVPGVFDRPNDDSDGGTLHFHFEEPVHPCSLTLVDIDNGASEASLVIQTDQNGRQRVHTVPRNWTGDILQGGLGHLGLDLTSLDPQPGFGSVVTAVEDPGFEPDTVRDLDVRLGGSGAVDDLHWGWPESSLGIRKRVKASARTPADVRAFER